VATRRLMFRIYRDARGEWRWRLKAGNGRCLADSGEGYRERRACVAAVQRLRHGAEMAGSTGRAA